jgi:dienelactone hydrolase
MKALLLHALACIATALPCYAQVVDSKTIDGGSSGPYKAIAATEATLPQFTVYRPKDLAAAAQAAGKLPILVFGNGGCSNTSITHERVLSEIASHGYVIVAIGPLAKEPPAQPARTESSMLIDAMDWITGQAGDRKSEYFGKVDTTKMGAMGQSCGGAQVLYAASDPRVKTAVMFNSGIGNMTMAKADKESLIKLHSPIVYIIGGPSDVAYPNAEMDFDRIGQVPVAVTNLDAGHMGTFGEAFGGSFSRMTLAWLDWQFKGKGANAAIFLRNELVQFPGWTVKSKNFNR